MKLNLFILNFFSYFKRQVFPDTETSSVASCVPAPRVLEVDFLQSVFSDPNMVDSSLTFVPQQDVIFDKPSSMIA